MFFLSNNWNLSHPDYVRNTHCGQLGNTPLINCSSLNTWYTMRSLIGEIQYIRYAWQNRLQVIIDNFSFSTPTYFDCIWCLNYRKNQTLALELIRYSIFPLLREFMKKIWTISCLWMLFLNNLILLINIALIRK